jgi:hypothetical protein
VSNGYFDIGQYARFEHGLATVCTIGKGTKSPGCTRPLIAMPLSMTINQCIRAAILTAIFISPNYKCDVGRYDRINKLEIHKTQHIKLPRMT